MKTLSFTEFRKRASEILTLVEKGETVRVIRHGKTVAKIVPAPNRGEYSVVEATRLEVGPSQSIPQQGHFGGKAEVTLNVFFDLPPSLNDTSKRKEAIRFKPFSLLLQR
ncbi:MAG TPA: type II toxin-antitoxin system Phd/YefM family antitoxin [Pyrinomonadaceae bacterium]|nr:type II toxin-antitoxin system Phd/YefM family antitoxin [Pyrinomonadaceae bacterium]